MLKFKIIESLKSNTEILEVIKNYTYKINKGKIKYILHTNLQVIEPTEYQITYPTTITILDIKLMKYLTKTFTSKNIIKNIISKKLSKF